MMCSVFRDHKPCSSSAHSESWLRFSSSSCCSNTLHASDFISPERKLQSHSHTHIKCFITSFSFVKSSTCFNWINKEQFWEMQILSWQRGVVNARQKHWDFCFISEGYSYSFYWDDRSRNNGRDKQPGKDSKKPAYKRADAERKQNERTLRLATYH